MWPTRCLVLFVPLVVACFYTADETGPIIVLAVAGIHASLLWLFPYKRERYSTDCVADRNRHIALDACFALGALLAVAAFWEPHAAVPAVVFALLGDVLCVAETDACEFRDPFGPYIPDYL